MGLIIPWGDIHTDRVVSVRAFEHTAHQMLQTIAMHPNIIKGAAFVGSISRGDVCPLRSDLDLIVVARDPTLPLVKSLVCDFVAMAAERRIALDACLIGANEAYHSPRFGPSYRETFSRVHRDFSVGVPLDRCFRVPPGSVQDEMVAKMAFKLRSTRARAGLFYKTRLELQHGSDRAIESWLNSSWRRVVRPMRVHITLGRRLLWWHHGRLDQDGKRDVIDQFLSEPTFTPFHEDYQQLMSLDQDYDVLLDQAHAGQVKRVHYLRKVGRLLRRNFQVSQRLLHRVLGHMTKESLYEAA